MLKTSRTLVASLFLAGALPALNAQAVPVTFDFTSGSAWTNGDLSFNDTTNTHSVSAGAFNDILNYNSPSSSRAHIGSNSYGLTACSGFIAGGNCWLDDHQIDSTVFNEDIKLTFGGEVTLLSATFTFWSDHDDFSLFVGDDMVTLYQKISGSGSERTFDFSTLGGDLTDSVFYIGARGILDAFKLKSITVDIPTAVPEPTALALWSIGLLGLGIARRRQR